jgi:CheY-like chemotaxis protein
VARILVADPSPEISDLLTHIVLGMGHEPSALSDVPEAGLAGVDVMVYEPGNPAIRAAARALRAARPCAALVGVSIYPPDDETSALEPFAYLIKPFSLGAIQRAIAEALANACDDEVAAV